MFHRATKTYFVVVVIFVTIFFTIQVLRSSRDSSSTSSTWSSNVGEKAKGWTEWMWPSYSGDETAAPDGYEREGGHAPVVPDFKPPHNKGKPDEHGGSGKGPAGEKAKQKDPETGNEEDTGVPTGLRWGAESPTSSATTSTDAATTRQGTHTSTSESSASAATAAVSIKPTLNPQNSTFEVDEKVKYDPAGPKPHQIVVLTAADGKGHNNGIENIMESTAENRKAYCDKHGYINHFVNLSNYDLKEAHPVWGKLPAIVETFQTFPDVQWIWFLDLDAIIMTPNVSLADHLLSEKAMEKQLLRSTEYNHELGLYSPASYSYPDIDLVISQDHNGLNAGSFFLRRSTYTQILLDMWADPFFVREDWPGREQDTLLHFLKHHGTFRKHLGLVNQRVMNAYPLGGDEMGWREGDLAVHMAGCWVEEKCQEYWEKFWKMKGA